MNVSTSRRLSTLLAAGGLVWSIGVSSWIWVSPIRQSGTRTMAWSYTDVAGAQSSGGIQTVPFDESHRFAEVSLLGATPLVIPVLLAGWGAYAAWRNRRLQLGVSAGLLAAFCVLAGFSIGPAFFLSAAGIVLAFVARLDAEPALNIPRSPHLDRRL